MRKMILKINLSPGDAVMLTAAVRDLHSTCPGAFVTDVRTPCPALRENNPYVTALADDDREIEQIECHYPLIGQSNQTPYHFIHDFVEFLNQKVGLQIRPTAFRGDIHLSATEKHWMSQVHEITRSEMPFWIGVAGGKYDFTAKSWTPERYRRVVDHFRDKILFVQVGEASHYHPTLNGVLDRASDKVRVHRPDTRRHSRPSGSAC
jgi:ADP-heptose:LPS heptosyltransferase